jgi:uncharacterized protein (TIGR03435 family)
MIPATFAPLASHLWQSTLFAAVAGLLTMVLRRNQARVRYWLWLAASYKFLLPFSWLVSIGHQFQWRAAPAILPQTFSAVTDFVMDPISLTALPVTNPEPDRLPGFVIALWAVWACGLLAVAVGWARQWLHIRAMVHAASPLPLGLPIRVLSTTARLEPGVVGIFRPVLLLPEGIAVRLTQPQLQAVLAHELCHVGRRDNLAAAVHMLVEALFWFHPLVWWLGARLVDERERACDEEVLQAGSQAQVYAESILKVCEFYLESPLTCVSGVTGSDLKERIQRIMKNHFGVTLSARKKFLLATIGVAALTGPLVFGVLVLPAGQSSGPPQWQTDAGGRTAFDVASVKVNKCGLPPSCSIDSNVFLVPGDTYSPTGGLLTVTNWPLMPLIVFAYKLDANSYRSLGPQLPKWANTERFDIQARAADSNPSKDQMRLMLQSLLADRFKLAVHIETRQLPVYALVLEKPGKTGPQLHPHSDDPPCATAVSSTTQLPPVAGGYPAICGWSGAAPGSGPGHVRMGGRNVTMELIGSSFGTGQVGRPVLDRTGLKGYFDYTIEWTPARNSPPPPGAEVQPALSGPTFLEALQEQLGLNLEPQTGPVDVLIIDHVEEPAEN